ncbi:MAG: phosphonate ABC transporter ATP-binding protein [Bdellovibrionales bacterium RIFCSPHIGHO2_01_FULL_40_29]|nr:MAG: phosphonate ABC transporter ATP-binding protein [Bdellovibrionales bacterium RIFCSPHIGHO2_01_FULL_40_29]OFZ35452.1 MAG: phosphonate ABC transporter ATP-binding protein [Bdellovibrionales bacterium RIFCSPHIGHO2_02_FULL_40_15]
MKILEVIHLKKSFRSDFYKPAQQVLKDISFSVEKGQFVGFIGPNGAGKTTTLKCALEFIFPDSGEVRFFDEKFALHHRQKIGFLPERPFFQEFLTGIEFLNLHWSLSQQPAENFKNRSMEVLEQVKLTHAKDKKLKDYSKGMLQRIGIAQALITEPELLIFDEPMSGLDPDGRILIKQILLGLKEQKKTILMSSHLLEDVEELCSQIIIVHAGQIVYSGPLAEFTKNFKTLEAAYRQFKIDLNMEINT